MNMREDISSKAEEFLEKEEELQSIRKGKRRLEDFRRKFPFRENPEEIDELSPKNIYNPEKGETDYFFNWIEHRLRPLGGIFVWSARRWKNAVKNMDRLKELLKIAVDDEKPLSMKIDAPWENIKGFGGDKHIAKKIVSVYYPERIIPIFKTEHLERICRILGISPEREAKERKGKDYGEMTVGEKWELHNELLSEAKRGIEPLKGKSNALFMRFLYNMFEVKKPTPKPPPIPSPLVTPSLLFEPDNELGVMMLFAEHHKELGFPYMVKVSAEFPDATVLSEDGEPKDIEFEYRSSTFPNHGHDPEKCDYIVCWVDDWENPPKKVEIVSLKEKLEELEIY